MQILGIEFAPLRIPLHRRLQTVAAASWFITLALGGFFGLIFSLYLAFFTRFWWIILLYYGWIYYDRDVCERGGRPIKWVRNLSWWHYLRDYFPLQVTSVPDAKLDPKRNYLFCCFPHGVLATGPFNAFGTDVSEVRQLFPNHVSSNVALHQHFVMPLFREFALAIGGISASAKSIDYVLGRPEGGHIVVLTPGGAAESYNSRPGHYKILVKKRKGFVKLALKNGTPLVPVVSFGETDLFEQLAGPNLYRLQEFLRKYIGIAPVIPVGRGFFQYNFGLIPRRKKITTVVGAPIEVNLNANPTNDEVDELHALFIKELKSLFENYKHTYLENPEEKYLEID